MTSMAAKLGYNSGFAIDLTTEDEDGNRWDLAKIEMQKRAEAKLMREAPWLLVLSPQRTMFSTLQALNFCKQDEAAIRDRMKDAVAHIAFAVKLCLLQARSGRKFMIEQPAGASSWGTHLM